MRRAFDFSCGFVCSAILLQLITLTSTVVLAQATISSGAIQGIITDQNGAVIQGATIKVVNLDTSAQKELSTDSAGFYSAASLAPGSYEITVNAPNFAKTTATYTVRIGTITNGDLHLKVGKASEQVVVSTESQTVNTAQSTVQAILTASQIDNLPISGRNFLDLSQLEPGVQLQDGAGFDPTKGGYSSVSFNGVNGRTARILLDGQDISDETVGTTTLNVSAGSIEEFLMSRSSLDISNELTSSGAVTVSTRAGSNDFHGQAFGLLRDQRAGNANQAGGTNYYFQRSQFGGRVGGYFVPEKLFFFGNYERVKQDAMVPYNPPTPFQGYSGSWGSPYRDSYSVGRIDYNGPLGVHMFFRGAYENNLSANNFGAGYARYANKDNTPIWAGGADFLSGKFTHSLRASYLKFHNQIVDQSAGLPNPVPGIYLSIHNFRSGFNVNAPQQTYQSDKQFRYDGAFTFKAHALGYGISINRILGGGLAAFFANGPGVYGSGKFSKGPVGIGGSGDPSDPTAYLTDYVVFGNGQGFNTEKRAFGMPAGGQEDWRLGVYVGDTWKMRPRFTVNYGIRYSRDTGRSNADLAPTPCSDAVAAFGQYAPCTQGNLLNALTPGLGEPVRQPNANFGPKGGFAWDLKGNGRTVIRGGLGLYFENSVFNNVLFDRAGRLPKGLFYVSQTSYAGDSSIGMPDGSTLTEITCPNGTTRTVDSLWSQAISVAGPCFAAIQKIYQQKTIAVGASANPAYTANTLTQGDFTGNFIYSPNYRTARSLQINLGLQREFWKGGILSVDYLRNIGTHFMQRVDENHVGDARYLNVTAARNAINRTLSDYEAADIDQAIANGATIGDFAGNGLDSGRTLFGGAPSTYGGEPIPPDQGAAFSGKNPLFGEMDTVYPMGRSVYNGLQASFRQTTPIPWKAIKGSNLEISYSYSRFLTSAGGQDGSQDQNFSPPSWDNNSPLTYMGPGGLDRRQQLSYGGNVTWVGDIHTSFIGHYYTPLSTNLRMFAGGNSAGEIFMSDITGDGTTQDILPGVKPGAFMRSVTPKNLASVIANYNATAAGRFTPAGYALINAGLFTPAQLTALGAVTRTIAAPIPHNIGNDSVKTFDFVLGKSFKIPRLGEDVSIHPSVSFFNLLNFANFSELTGDLYSEPQPLSASGTNSSIDPNDDYNRDSLRRGNGSGVFGQGTSRVIEYGLKINF